MRSPILETPSISLEKVSESICPVFSDELFAERRLTVTLQTPLKLVARIDRTVPPPSKRYESTLVVRSCAMVWLITGAAHTASRNVTRATNRLIGLTAAMRNPMGEEQRRHHEMTRPPMAVNLDRIVRQRRASLSAAYHPAPASKYFAIQST